MGKITFNIQDFEVNPNILDNWYFGNPVNQREKTSYKNGVFTIDRWRMSGTSCALTVNNGYISFKASGYDYLETMIPNHYAGKTLTISGLFKNSENISVDIVRNDGVYIIGDPVSYYEKTGYNINLFSYSFQVPSNYKDPLLIRVGAEMGEDFFGDPESFQIDLYAFKLELGDKQTLAHEGTNTWILNEIPDYGEQLARCQRYFWKPKRYSYYLANSNLFNEAMAINIPFPVTMYEPPALSWSNLTGDISRASSYTSGCVFVANGTQDKNGWWVVLDNFSASIGGYGG